jgi:hypothetical protein
MVARSVHQGLPAAPAWHAAFLEMLPTIRRVARFAFRGLPRGLRAELIEEVVANAVAAYSRLVDLGRGHLGYPSALARYGVRQVRAGRRVGNRLKGRDVMSECAQRRHGFRLDRLDMYCEEDETWQEIIVEDKRATPAEIAACRLDFSSWLRRLPRLRRRIALALATGATTSEAAKKFCLTAGRISQIRLWLRENWDAFQCDAPTPNSAAA